MIDIKDKKDCCGCNACGDICNQGAISFKTDEEGFWYPVVDTALCTDCHLCERVCPILNLEKAKKHGQQYPKVYGGFHKNVTIRFDSTSGGVFSALANHIYKQKGYVSGAVFNDDWSVSNYISNNKRDLSWLRSSKYVQSNAEGLYRKIKKLLVAGEKVLACGSPCQMAALRTYLVKDYENLIIVDFLCRATNSPKAYRKYLDYLEETHGGKIISIKAKNKDHGWRSLARKVVFDNGRVYYGEGHEDHYRRGYHGNYFERPSCYDCKFKGIPRISDITMGDFWGIDKIAPSLDHNLGTSMILANTDKGIKFVEAIRSKMELKEFTLDDVLLGNRGPIMGNCCTEPKNFSRVSMFREMDTLRFDELAAKYFPEEKHVVGKKTLLKKAIKYLLKSIVHPCYFFRNLLWKLDCRVSGRINVYSHCAIDLHKGAKIKINNGILNIGVKKNRKSKAETRLFMDTNARLNINGSRSLMYNSDIQVFRDAELSFGSGNCNSGLQIVCAEKISIGKETYIGRDVWIRDNNGGHTIVQTGYTNSAPVIIGDFCWIGSNVVIMKGVTIGDGSVIAANSVVTSNIPPHSMATGNPAQVISENITWIH